MFISSLGPRFKQIINMLRVDGLPFLAKVALTVCVVIVLVLCVSVGIELGILSKYLARLFQFLFLKEKRE